MSFELHPNLLKKIWLHDLPLCTVLLEDEKHYPWLMLVPRKNQVSRIIDLSLDDQWQLMKELNIAQKILWEKFCPIQLNIAAIGNKTPQLHVHVIGRYQDDPAWPGTVWDHPVKEPYPADKKEELIQSLRLNFHSLAT